MGSDLVTVGYAPVTVQLVRLLRPIVGSALLNSGAVDEIASHWSDKNAETKGCDYDRGENSFTFNHRNNW